MKTESQNLKIESQKLEGPKPRENRITIAKQNPKIPERGNTYFEGMCRILSESIFLLLSCLLHFLEEFGCRI